MVKAWYLDEKNQPEFGPEDNSSLISLEELFKKTGVEYFKINIDTYATDGVLDKIKEQRGYTYEDEMSCNNKCGDLQEKLKTFFTEHLHTDEEIRLVMEGSGYFDLRDCHDQWVRVEVVSGDMLILPRGIYHRFTLTPENFIRAKRFFIGEPVWKAYNRPADDMSCRQDYLSKVKSGFETTAA